VADLPRFEAEYASLHEHWAQVAEQLPTDRQLPALMRKITLAAQQNGVNFLTFRPGGAKQDQHFTETPIQLAVYGNYHELGAFLADLANMRRIITVSGVQVKTNTRAHPGTATATADFTASAYHLNTTSTAPPAPPEAQAKKEESHGKES
jgi:type IV pilus assembly protein PilO